MALLKETFEDISGVQLTTGLHRVDQTSRNNPRLVVEDSRSARIDPRLDANELRSHLPVHFRFSLKSHAKRSCTIIIITQYSRIVAV